MAHSQRLTPLGTVEFIERQQEEEEKDDDEHVCYGFCGRKGIFFVSGKVFF